MSWDYWERQAEKGPVAIAWRAMAVLFMFVVVFVGAAFSCQVIGNPFKQAARIMSKTIDADNVIYNYEWFKLRHEGILAVEMKERGAKAAVSQFKSDAGPRSQWKRDDREEAARLSTIRLGLSQQQNDLAAEYNAKSRMVNRKIFKAGDTMLPVSIKLIP